MDSLAALGALVTDKYSKVADTFISVWGRANDAAGRFGLWFTIISVAVGALFAGVGAGAGLALAYNVGIGLLISTAAQKGVEGVKAWIDVNLDPGRPDREQKVQTVADNFILVAFLGGLAEKKRG